MCAYSSFSIKVEAWFVYMHQMAAHTRKLSQWIVLLSYHWTHILHHDCLKMCFFSCRTPKGYSKTEFERAVDWSVTPLHNFVLSKINYIWKYSCTKSFQKYRRTGGSIRRTWIAIKQIFSLKAVFCSQWWKVCVHRGKTSPLIYVVLKLGILGKGSNYNWREGKRNKIG